jgi:hypothetical protein
MDRPKAIRELARIQKELQVFRTKHGQSAYEYYTEKAEYNIKEQEYIKFNLDQNKTLTKTSLKEGAVIEHKAEYSSYKEAEGQMEGYDRTLRNLDAQRSIIQTILNQLDKEDKRIQR